MHICNLAQWISQRAAILSNLTIGFVPTMGNLHNGHASLIKKSCAENDITVVSIFVNPLQFNQQDDYINYLKTPTEDTALLRSLGVSYCFMPTQEDIYPQGMHYTLTEHDVSESMEGLHRPGHFQGVLTVVMKLLQLVKPQTVYLGEKDYQQYLLIKGMIDDFFMGIKTVVCPTLREPSGLAYSSRNHRLSVDARVKADKFAKIFLQQDKSVEKIIDELSFEGITVEYIEDHNNRRFAAVVINGVRLIDNWSLDKAAR